MSAVDYLELTAIIAGAAFGVLGTMTETKDKKKQLTTWGWVAVAGVVVTNGFSLVTTSLKQQQSTQDEINRLKIEKVRIAHQDSANKRELHLQDSVIRISNYLATSQVDLQRRSTDMLAQLGNNLQLNRKLQSVSGQINSRMSQNLLTQRMLFDTMRTVNGRTAQLVDQQYDLIGQQAEIDAHVTKSLNPLLPFSVAYDLLLASPNAQFPNQKSLYRQWYIYADKRLLTTINKYRKLKDTALYFKTGLWRYKSGNEIRYEVRSPYKNYKDFAFLEKLRPTIELSNLTGKKIERPFKVEMGQVNELTLLGYPQFKYSGPHLYYEEDYDAKHYTLNGIDIIYSETTGKLNVNYYVTNIVATDDLGNISSTLDLEGHKTSLRVYIDCLPSEGKILNFDLYFQPNFSRQMSAHTISQNKWSNEKGLATSFRDTLDFFYNRMP